MPDRKVTGFYGTGPGNHRTGPKSHRDLPYPTQNSPYRTKKSPVFTVPRQNILNGVAASIDLPNESIDLAFTSGVLIHIHPNNYNETCIELSFEKNPIIIKNEPTIPHELDQKCNPERPELNIKFF